MGIFLGVAAHLKSIMGHLNYLFQIILNGQWFVEIWSLIFTFLNVLCPSSSEKWYALAILVEGIKHLYEPILKLGMIDKEKDINVS